MKKMIILMLAMMLIPWGSVLLASLASEEISIGKGDNSVEYHCMGKNVLVEINGLYKSMDVEEYLLGVLPGVISPDYEEEALKVQAVLVRTNLLKEMEEKGSADAKDLSYSYMTAEERKELFGERNYERYEKAFERAVVETAGTVIRQEGALIMALYHEVSIGKTASAKEVLGEDISYLQSVESSMDVEARHYMNVVNYTWEELKRTEEGKEKDVAEDSLQKNIEITECTENGFVKQLSVNGDIYTGEQAMEMYGLSSSNFYVEEVENGVRFVCLGKGNCMGVSQYGANRMAMEGAPWKDILLHYYGKVSVESYN